MQNPYNIIVSLNRLIRNLKKAAESSKMKILRESVNKDMMKPYNIIVSLNRLIANQRRFMKINIIKIHKVWEPHGEVSTNTSIPTNAVSKESKFVYNMGNNKNDK